MNRYKWSIQSSKQAKSINELIAQILSNREINDIISFQNDDPPYLYAQNYLPFKELFFKIDNSIKIIKNAIRNDKTIIIHGDYDADGQTATAILWQTIYNNLKYKNVVPFLPNRFDHGYGVSQKSVEHILNMLDEKCINPENSLIITVDCGITNVNEIKLLKGKGVNVIISDHHQLPSKQPKANEIVWTDKATGAGIAWLLAKTLLTEFNVKHQDNLYTDLAAIGTICDLQPLTEFNRSLVKVGLLELSTTNNIGINAMKEIANINDTIDTYEVGWIIGPRLNAAGRLDSPMDALRLLSTNSKLQAKQLAKKLDSLNSERQDKTKKDYTRAFNKYENTKELPNFLLVHNEKYHEGIIGLVAGKLCSHFYRPAIAIAIDKKSELAKGSVRSISGINIVEVLKEIEHLFESIGGHAQAAGFSIKPNKINALEQFLNSYKIDPDTLTPKLNIDTVAESNLINFELLDELNKLKPFGIGNKQPILLTRSLKIINTKSFGKDNNHLKLFVTDKDMNEYTAIGFGLGEYKQKLEEATVDIAYQLRNNTWNGSNNLELLIKDIALVT